MTERVGERRGWGRNEGARAGGRGAGPGPHTREARAVGAQRGGRPLTVPAAGEEGHAVDGDGHSAVLAVEVVDVVGGAEAGGHPRPLGRPQQQQQRQQRQQRPPGRGWGGARAPPRPAPPGGHLGPAAATSQPHGRARGSGAAGPREAPPAPSPGRVGWRAGNRSPSLGPEQRNQLDSAGGSGVRGATTPRSRTPGSMSRSYGSPRVPAGRSGAKSRQNPGGAPGGGGMAPGGGEASGGEPAEKPSRGGGPEESDGGRTETAAGRAATTRRRPGERRERPGGGGGRRGREANPGEGGMGGGGEEEGTG